MSNAMKQPHTQKNAPAWDTAFIERNNTSAPRYTSYPTAMAFHEEFGVKDYLDAAARSNQKQRPLSLYLHLPFCNTVCYYCACNKIVTADRKRSRRYLDSLIQELAMQGALFDRNRPVVQLHWGGGTPTFFSASEMTELMYHIGRNFNLLPGQSGEYSIEIDPRQADIDTLSLLHGLGFNRISLGVQDFDPKVQQAVNRVQPYAMVAKVFEQARNLGFAAINTDLIYGLPYQTPESYQKTIEQLLTLKPDRISLFNYAHLPHRFKTQQQIQEEALPKASTKVEILCATANALTEAGYVHIGMDHFAKANDSLVSAQKQGTLQRNFQGYSIAREADLVGLGVSAIGHVDNTYSQNFKSIPLYEEALKNKQLPIERGYILNADDLLRQDIIGQLSCHNKINIPAIETKHAIHFATYFSRELIQLKQCEAEGLVDISKTHITVSALGHLVIRRLCLIFDAHTAITEQTKHYSRIL